MVYGFDIVTVDLKIYNRWGEKIFDSQGNYLSYWDGRYKSEFVSTGVYAYRASIVFTDGATLNKEGEHYGVALIKDMKPFMSYAFFCLAAGNNTLFNINR